LWLIRGHGSTGEASPLFPLSGDATETTLRYYKNTPENVSYEFCCRNCEIEKLLITLSLTKHESSLIVLLQMTNGIKKSSKNIST
jgi:hypothetical protein